MKLWFEAHFLFALLSVSSSALTPECEDLVKPLPLNEHSQVYGKSNFLLGYIDHDSFKTLLKAYDSSWMNVTFSPFRMTQGNRINGTCFESVVNMTLEDNTARIQLPGLSADYKLLSSHDGLMLLSANITVANLQKVLESLKVEATVDAGEATIHGFYLYANETTVTDSDLEHFKKQANCLGFTGEPDFHYNPEKEFCEEGKGNRV
ncbi:uncharacterized protein LOC110966035 [Acanthochromis polyacanthus]|uniref:Uncharacterized LOC110966035 n=1 Tax=Acanthochromis polyacanthus TaxID=80966 RepID=A0A3Q1FLD7_9TELE|nr:uncharacterized protein LOC110966035 [Acanthochromis polyacanthus]